MAVHDSRDPPTCRGLFRAESPGQAIGIYLPASAASRSLGLIRSVVLAWLLSPGEYGLVLVALLVINVLTPLGGLSLHEAVTRYVPAYEARGAVRAFVRRMAPVALTVALVMTALLLLAAAPLGIWLFRSLEGSPRVGDDAEIGARALEIVSITRWVVAAVLVSAVYFFVLSILKGLRMFRAIGLMEFSQAFGFTVAAALATLGGAAFAQAVLFCYVATALCVTLAFAGGLRRRLKAWPEQQQPIDADDGLVARAVRFSTWSMGAAVMYQLLQNYPTWYVNKIHGPETAAVFGAMRTLGQVTLLVAVAFVTVVATMITRVWETQGREAADGHFHLTFKATGLLLLAISAGVAAAKPLVVRVFPAGFAAGQGVIDLLLLFFLLMAFLLFLSLHFSLIEKTRLIFWLWSVGVAGNVVFAAIWVRPTPIVTASDLVTARLVPAAQAGVAGMTVALMACLLMLRVERRPIDRGSWLVLLTGFALCLPWQVNAAVVALLLVLARPLVFSREEATVLVRQAAAFRAFIAVRVGRRGGATM